MGWPKEAFLHLRQIAKPGSRPQSGGNLLYTKADNRLYLLDADGTEHDVGGDGGVATVVAGDQVVVDATDPESPIVGTTGLVESVTAGTNATVDNTDPLHPVVSGVPGLPTGGATAETLAKLSATSYDVAWIAESVPAILLPAGSNASDVPVGTPVGTIVLIKAS